MSAEFELELALDRLIAALEPAVAAHLAAWWRAACGSPAPVPPLPTELALASTRRVLAAAGAEPMLAAVARPWWRMAIVAAVEADGAVAEARAEEPSWAALGPLAEAREAAARRIGFDGFAAVAAEALLGGGSGDGDRGGDGDRDGDRDGGRDGHGRGARWGDDLPACDEAAVRRVLTAFGERHGVAIDGVTVAMGRELRTFVVVPGRDVRIVLSGGRTLAAWRGALHEIGHGLVGALGAWPARAVDEAVATFIADHLTRPEEAAAIIGPALVAAADIAAAARVARQRRRRAADMTAAFEAALYRDPGGDLDARWHRAAADAGWDRRWAVPPAPLWNDPGAQAAYQRAERAAPRLARRLAAGTALASAIAEADA